MTERTEGSPNSEQANAAGYDSFKEGLLDISKIVERTPRRSPILDLTQDMWVKSLMRGPTADNLYNFVQRKGVPITIMNDDSYFPPEKVLREEVSASGQYLPSNGSDNYRLLSVMSLTLMYAKQIDQIKCRTVGVDAPAAASNYIISAALERMGWISALSDYASLKENDQILDLTRRFGYNLLQEDDERVAWYGPKVTQFTVGLDNGLCVAKYLESLAVPSSEDEETATEALRRANDELFAETRRFASYAVKSAVVPSSTDGTVKEWLVSDEVIEKANYEGASLHGPNAATKYFKQTLAQFVATASEFTSSKIDYQATQSPSGERVSIVNSNLSEIIKDPTEDIFILRLGFDGQLHTTHGFDIREYFEHAGAGLDEYEKMRAEILSIYTDLVTPVWVEKFATEDIPASRKERGLPQLKPDEKPSFTDLVIARVRTLQVFHNEIVADLEEELEENIVKPEVLKASREIVKHDVVGHTRKLSPNHKASPEARRLALEEGGIELPEFGLTWEKAHKRGTLPNPSVGHRAKRTRTSEARQTNGEQNGNGSPLPSQGEVFPGSNA